MDRFYKLSVVNIQIAGAAMDWLLNNPHLMKGTPPEKVADLKATRDLFESMNSENNALGYNAPPTGK